jgi:hypothetical protein
MQTTFILVSLLASAKFVFAAALPRAAVEISPHPAIPESLAIPAGPGAYCFDGAECALVRPTSHDPRML